MVLLKKVEHKGSGLVGTTEEGAVIPLREVKKHHVAQLKKDSIYGMGIRKGKNFVEEAIRIAQESSRRYYILEAPIRNGDFIQIGYTQYEPFSQ